MDHQSSIFNWNYNMPSIKASDLKNLILKRDFLLENIFKPFFDGARNCFVRVKIKDKYYVLLIKDIVYDKEYGFEKSRVKLRTDKYLTLRLGSEDITVPITNLSNQNPEEDEINEFLKYNKVSNFRELWQNHERAVKLFKRELSTEERIRTEDEKRKFVFDLGKRVSYFKADILTKKKEAQRTKRPELAAELENVYLELNRMDGKLDGKKINEIGRKYGLKVKGEAQKVEMVKNVDFCQRASYNNGK